jgi:hypothetical protein
LDSWLGTQIIHLSTHISFCQIEMTSVTQYSILWIQKLVLLVVAYPSDVVKDSLKVIV